MRCACLFVSPCRAATVRRGELGRQPPESPTGSGAPDRSGDRSNGSPKTVREPDRRVSAPDRLVDRSTGPRRRSWRADRPASPPDRLVHRSTGLPKVVPERRRPGLGAEAIGGPISWAWKRVRERRPPGFARGLIGRPIKWPAERRSAGDPDVEGAAPVGEAHGDQHAERREDQYRGGRDRSIEARLELRVNE